MMGIPELVVLAFWVLALAVVVWPIARICSRIGFSPWFGLIAIVPLGNVVLLWVLAYVRWPLDGTMSAAGTERRTS